MMQSTRNFTGLTMPVFTAFGWAGEETAIKYALSQLELFIGALHARLPRSAQDRLPAFGLSQETQAVYLAASSDVESDVHLVFFTRPLSLEIQLAITDKKVLEKGLQQAEKEPVVTHRLITELGPEWTLRIQQMQVDEETGEASHYHDLFKDTVSNLDEEAAVALINKTAYLNSEPKWVTPIYLSRRIPSEQAAAMGPAITQVMAEQIMALMPLLTLLSGRTGQKAKSRTKGRSRPQQAMVTEVEPEEIIADIKPKDEFSYLAVLKPLHLRRGFVELTPKHWPFFELNSRTETRAVIVYYNGIYDKSSAVWRLQPNDQARLVLSPAVHEWLENTFGPNDRVQVVARKLADEEIQISLRSIE